MMEFRVAFRREGRLVNAYLAYPTTMERSVLIASVADGFLQHPDTWAEYQEFVKRALARGGFEFGETRPAPQNERAGNA